MFSNIIVVVIYFVSFNDFLFSLVVGDDPFLLNATSSKNVFGFRSSDMGGHCKWLSGFIEGQILHVGVRKKWIKCELFLFYNIIYCIVLLIFNSSIQISPSILTLRTLTKAKKIEIHHNLHLCYFRMIQPSYILSKITHDLIPSVWQ